MKTRISALLLTAAMAFPLALPALAYDTPDFTDVPRDDWAYEYIMRMADAGYIQGVGEGRYAPDVTVSAAQFLTLVGRVVFPEVTADGEDWSGPYVQAAQQAGWLTGTDIQPEKAEDPVTRYDMAAVLAKAAEKLGIGQAAVNVADIKDYGNIPTKYAEAVKLAYGQALIQGDDQGNFNGLGKMTRNQLATVIDRLISLKPDGAETQQPQTPEEPEPPVAQKEIDTTGSYWVDPETGEPYELEYIYVNNKEGIHGFSDRDNNRAIFYKAHDGFSLEITPIGPEIDGTLPAGVTVGFYYKDGTLLASAVTDENGDWEMEVPLHKGFNEYESAYFVEVIDDQVEINGVTYKPDHQEIIDFSIYSSINRFNYVMYFEMLK